MCAMKLPEIGSPPYTYADYVLWPNEERWEIIDGVPYNMTPAPSRMHQKISSFLHGEIYSFLKDKDCEVYHAPFDVRLLEQHKNTETTKEITDKQITTIVQPDLSIICDKTKLDDRGCLGAPDFIIEIVSPATATHDYVRKLRLYEKHGVKEYWIVHPLEKMIMVRTLQDDNTYTEPTYYGPDEEINVFTLEGLTLRLADIFTE